MLKQEFRAAFFVKEQPEELRIITIYRFVSLLCISVFFCANSNLLSLIMKFYIVACIGLSSIILNYLYHRSIGLPGNIKVLVFIEIIGNSVLLIPTGGLNSLFVWYSINTILIAAVMLSSLYCWINLGVYLFTSTCLVYLFFNKGELKLTEFIANQSNLMLSLTLITAIVIQLAMYIKRLRAEGIKQLEINRKLNTANKMVRESVDHIMELYQTVYMFTTVQDKADIISTIMDYTKKLTKTDRVFFYSLTEGKERMILNGGGINNGSEAQLISRIKDSWASLMDSAAVVKLSAGGKNYLAASVRSNCIIYGVLGIEVAPEQLSIPDIGFVDQLKFIAGLSSIVIEKFEAEKVNERLVIAEEQNRIANEIHDSVLQRLFSTSFGIYSLMRNTGTFSQNELIEELNLIRNSIDNAMKELRSTIYGMSFNKRSSDNFIEGIIKFIDETKRLNNIKIDFRYMGKTGALTLLHKRALYRIICEGIGNAIRHGCAKEIRVVLKIQENLIVLKITDNGTGFDVKQVRQSNGGGLGIKNIEALVRYLDGRICLRSSIGKGTSIGVTCPLYTHSHEEEKIV